jgi:hypothetical protein
VLGFRAFEIPGDACATPWLSEATQENASIKSRSRLATSRFFEAELEHLLQVRAQLVEACGLSMGAGHTGHDAHVELGLLVEFEDTR